MRLLKEEQADRIVIRIDEDRLDAAIAIQFKDAMRVLTVDAKVPVVLDMASVMFLDSSGLGAIVAMMKHIGPCPGLSLRGVTPNVARVLRLTRMDSVLDCLPPDPDCELQSPPNPQAQGGSYA